MADSLDKGQDPAPLSVIIPILEDEPRLSHLLEKALADLADSGHTCEVIFVTADPHAPALSEVEGFPSVRFMTREGGSDWGDAILAASAQAQHGLICTLDVPSLYAATEIPRLVRALQGNDAAMAVGVRIGIQKPIPARLRLLPFILDMLASDALGRPLPDVNTGLRVIRRQTLCELTDRFPARPALPATLTFLLMAANARILFVPVDGDQEPGKRHRGRAREVLQLIRLIIAFGLELSPRRTWSLIARMALMMLMMAAMMLMMMWMMGLLPGLA